MKNYKFWDSVCETYEALNGVKGAFKKTDLDFSLKEFDALGKYYEYVTSKCKKSKYGQFFTPKVIAEYLIDSVGFDSRKHYADISCGSGRFLMCLAQRFINQQESLENITSRLVGYDIDPILVRITVANLRSILSLNKYPVDVNTKLKVSVKDSIQDLNSLFGDNNRFDCIVGNPPYLKASPKTNHGHPNLYASFVEAGVSQLNSGGGLAYIMPKSFVSGAYFRKLRGILQNEVQTREIITLHERNSAFNDVLQEQVLISLVKQESNKQDLKVGLATLNGKFQCSKFNAPFDLVFWKKDIMCVPSSKIELNLVKKCFMNGFKSVEESGLRVSTGQIVPFRSKELMCDDDKSESSPLYWPHNIVSGEFVPNEVKKGRKTRIVKCEKTRKSLMKGPVIAFKRISAKEQSKRIEATIVPKNESGYFLENHLNYIKRESEKAPSLEMTNLLLNSKLWDKLFRMINGNTQVSAKEIRIFPIPHSLSEINPQQLKKNNPVEQEKIIHKLYKLAPEETSYILGGKI